MSCDMMLEWSHRHHHHHPNKNHNFADQHHLQSPFECRPPLITSKFITCNDFECVAYGKLSQSFFLLGEARYDNIQCCGGVTGCEDRRRKESKTSLSFSPRQPEALLLIEWGLGGITLNPFKKSENDLIEYLIVHKIIWIKDGK